MLCPGYNVWKADRLAGIPGSTNIRVPFDTSTTVGLSDRHHIVKRK